MFLKPGLKILNCSTTYLADCTLEYKKLYTFDGPTRPKQNCLKIVKFVCKYKIRFPLIDWFI